MYLAWRYGGHDPFRLYHELDEHYLPLSPSREQRQLLPKASRLKSLIYGFGEHAEKMAAKLAGAK